MHSDEYTICRNITMILSSPLLPLHADLVVLLTITTSSRFQGAWRMCRVKRGVEKTIDQVEVLEQGYCGWGSLGAPPILLNKTYKNMTLRIP